MGRKVDVDLLVDATAIAERMGFARPQAVHNWRARHPDFPQPIAEFGKSTLWYWPDVDEWLQATGRHTSGLA